MGKIDIEASDGVTVAKLKDLRPYAKNPKDEASDQDYDRLVSQLKLGEHSPLLITDEGEVLGGNSRIRAYEELGREYVTVVVASFVKADGLYAVKINGQVSERRFKSIEQAKAELAISHNDQINPYNVVKLKDLFLSNDLPMGLYSIPSNIVPVETAIADHMAGAEDDSGEDNPQGGDNPRACPECGYEGQAKEFFLD